jgi:hypothetical protein
MNNTNLTVGPFSQPAPISNIYSSVFTFYNTSFTASNFNYALKLYDVDLGVGNTGNTLSFISEVFVPPRPVNSVGLFSPAKYLQNYFIKPDDYVSRIVPGQLGIYEGPYTNYQMSYGAIWNPQLQIAAIQKVAIFFIDFNIGFTFSQPHGLTANDIIFVSANDTAISGEQRIIPNGLTDYSFVIDAIWATPSVSTGFITSAKRYTGTSSVYDAWNGTNQFDSRSVDFGYLVAGNSNTDPSGTTQKFLSTYGSRIYTNTIIATNSVIEKKSSLFESIGFIADPVLFRSNTAADLLLNYKIYSATNSVLGTFSWKLAQTAGDVVYKRGRWETQVGYNSVSTLGFFNGSESYWDVYFSNSLNNNIVSEIRRYVIDDECSNYEPVIVAFINRLGSLDYFTFTQNSRKSMTINRNEWRKELNINTGNVPGSNPFSLVDRGRGIISQTTKQNIVINSNWLSEEDYSWLNELVNSQYIWIYEEYIAGTSIAVPVNIVDTSYEFKKKLTEQIFNLTLTLEYANDVYSANQNQ